MTELVYYESLYEYNKNFWEVNPEFLSLKSCKRIYDKDSEDKEESSKIMWAIYMIYDYDSLYSNMELKERINKVEHNILDHEGFFEAHWDEVKDIVDDYNDLQSLSEKRYLETFERKLDERRKFLNTVSYRLEGDDASKNIKVNEHIDRMLVNSNELMKQYETIMERMQKQRAKMGRIKGGKARTLSMKKGIFDKNQILEEYGNEVPRGGSPEDSE